MNAYNINMYKNELQKVLNQSVKVNLVHRIVI